jgi:hypothetical protein
MRTATCLECDYTRGLFGKEVEQLGSGQFATENRRSTLIRAMGMKNVLRDIQTNRGNL